jgi:hypothetical protein
MAMTPEPERAEVAVARHEATLRVLVGAGDAPRVPLRRLTRPGDTSARHLIVFATEPERIHVVLKQYAADLPGIDVQNEFRGLSTAHAGFRASRVFRAPRPYLYSDADRAIFMEYCPGLPLSRILFNELRWPRLGRYREAEVTLVDAAAAMLHHFQALALPGGDGRAPGDRQSVLEAYAGEMGIHLAECARLGVARRLLTDAQSAFDASLRASDHAARLVCQHTDFGPWNVLAAPSGQLVMLDLHRFTTGFEAYDLAAFWVGLELFNRHAVVARDRVLAMQRTLLGRFCGAHGGRGVPQWFDAFRLLEAVYLGTVLLSAPSRWQEIRYLPVPRVRFVERLISACLVPLDW